MDFKEHAAAGKLCASVALLLSCATAVRTAEERRPKVALCFFGLVKNTTELDIRNYRAAIVEPLQAAGFDVEGFLHTYRMHSFGNKRNREAVTQLRTNESIAMWRTLVPFRSVQVTDPVVADARFCPISKYLQHGDPWPTNPVVSLMYFLRQQYSLWSVTQELAAHRSEFAAAIYLRPDVRFLDKLDMRTFQQIVNSNRRAIATPNWQVWRGVNDRFAFGKTTDMIVYGERMLELDEYVKRSMPHAEEYLRDYLRSKKIETIGISTRFQRVRADGHAEENDSALGDPSFQY